MVLVVYNHFHFWYCHDENADFIHLNWSSVQLMADSISTPNIRRDIWMDLSLIFCSPCLQVVAGELELNHECSLIHWSPEDFECKLQVVFLIDCSNKSYSLPFKNCKWLLGLLLCSCMPCSYWLFLFKLNLTHSYMLRLEWYNFHKRSCFLYTEKCIIMRVYLWFCLLFYLFIFLWGGVLTLNWWQMKFER